MKPVKIVTSLLLYLVSFSCNTSSLKKIEPFSIKIKKEASLSVSEKEITITQDSILINTRESNKSYSHADVLPESGRQRLINILSNGSWNNLDSSYINSNVDDGADFTFTISYKNHLKKVNVHYARVEELFSIAQAIDTLLLPIQLQVGYDDSYLRY